MARKFSLAYLTLPGIEPLEQIEIAAQAGYDFVSLRTIPMGQEGEPQICLEKDPVLFKKVQEALKANNIKLLDIELLRIKEDLPVDYRKAFECGAKLGATDVLSSVWTEDRNLAVERYGRICEDAKEFGLTINLEFPIISGLKNLQAVLAVQEKVGAPNLKILMDMLYVYWTGLNGPGIKKINPQKFGLLHICDCPRDEQDKEKVEIMRGDREYCGQGIIDLKDIITALPANNCSIESPNYKYIEKYGRLGHAKRCLENAKKVFAEAHV